MTEKPPLVTVIAVCYNHSRFVIECLESIRAQTYTNVQLIIMDDCSSDESVTLISDWIKLHQIKCEFIAHEVNRGLCRTLNEAVKLSKGRYISMIATDDCWLPEKIKFQVSEMESMPATVGVLYSDAYRISENGQLLPKMFISSYREFESPPTGNLKADLLHGNFIPAMTTLIRRTVYEQIGLYDENLVYEDWDFWLRTSNYFDFAFSQYPSANYRIVSTSMARTILTPKNGEAHYSFFQINRKILAMDNIKKTSRCRTAQRMLVASRGMYFTDHPKALYALTQTFLLTRRPLSLYLMVLVLLGLPCAYHQRLVRTTNSIKNYVLWRYSQLKKKIESPTNKEN